MLVDLFVEAHVRAPKQIILDLDATDDPMHGEQEGRFFHGYYDCYCYLPLYVFCGRYLLLAVPPWMRRTARSRRWRASSRRFGVGGLGCASCCAPTRALRGTI